MAKETKPAKSVFETLNAIDVNGHTEKKNNLTYLSWAWAWAEVKKRYPSASYTVYHDDNHRPYVEDANFGIMCFTTVTIEDETIEMWLPVMDGANNAMKSVPYEIKTKYGSKPVAAATMFDINKTIMRCLVKNLAMFGLGLYIYAGEDLPEEVKEANLAAHQEAVAAQEAIRARKNAAMKALSLCKTIDEVDMFLDEYKDLTSNDKFLAYVNNYKSQLSA